MFVSPKTNGHRTGSKEVSNPESSATSATARLSARLGGHAHGLHGLLRRVHRDEVVDRDLGLKQVGSQMKFGL